MYVQMLKALEPLTALLKLAAFVILSAFCETLILP